MATETLRASARLGFRDSLAALFRPKAAALDIGSLSEHLLRDIGSDGLSEDAGRFPSQAGVPEGGRPF